MVAGLEEITEGEIILDGQQLNDLLPKDRNISMIFQSYAIWPHMTVKENITYPLKLKKIPKEKWNDIINQVAEITDISKYLDRYPSQLSGGQRQRVAVARAIAVKPKVFLMDEPLSNLDAKLRVSMRTKLREIHQDIGATTIFVTHDQAEAMSLADKIVVMNMGVIEQIGSPMEIYNDCESKFVANFIGAPPTNFFDVKIVEENGELFAKNEVISIPIKGDVVNSLKKNYINTEVIMGIRPENIKIDNEGVSGKIYVIEPQGSHTILAINVGKYQVKVLVPEAYDGKNNDEIKLKFNNNKILFFDKKTEKRIR